MPLQIKRLLIVFAIVIGLFLVLRHFLIPESFGEEGHYRFLAIAENAALEAKYQGEESCKECHNDIVELKLEGLHDVISCESCHGPARLHNISEESQDILKPGGRDFCCKCHSPNTARSDDYVLQIDIEEHNKGKNCVKCHNPHEPWQ